MSSILPTMVLARALLGTTPCEIVLEGATDQDSLRNELEARNLSLEREPACIGPVARVVRDEGRYVVSLRFEDGSETERRVVDGESTVAVLVESWKREDLVASLLEPVTPPIPAPNPNPSSATTSAVSEPAPILVESEPEFESLSSFELALGAEVATDIDGNPWMGAVGLVRPWVSDLAPLFLLRFNHNAIGGSPTTTGAARSGLEFLALFEPRFALGTFSMRPAIGGGLGLLHSTRGEDRTCVDACALVVQDDFAVTNFGPRLELRVAIGHPIGSSFSVELSAGASLSPLAEQGGLVPAYATETLPLAEQELLALPGEPLLLARVTLALAWERP